MRDRPLTTSGNLLAARRAVPGGGRSQEQCRAFPIPRPWSSPLLLERESLRTERQVSPLEDLRYDIRPLADLEVDDRRLAVLQFVERGQFGGVGLEVCELAVVPHRTDKEGLL